MGRSLVIQCLRAATCLFPLSKSIIWLLMTSLPLEALDIDRGQKWEIMGSMHWYS